jgi:hypothetical protein
MGLWRVKAAMFSKTFPGDAGDRLADTFFESVDHTTRNFENAISDVMPQLARAEGLVAAGRRSSGLSLSDDISKAIDMHARLKETGMSARDYVSQTAMFGKELNPTQERLLVHFSDQSRSRSGIRNTLSTYAQAIIDAPDPAQGTMFGGVQLSRDDLLNRVLAGEAQKAEVEKQERPALPGQILPLSKKTPLERGPIDADSLVAALMWDRIMDPEMPVEIGK